MLLDVAAVVRDLVPGLLAHGRPSVVCVRTTSPKYLVFDDDPWRPACVVEFGEAVRLQRVDRVLTELHKRVPGAVPRPVCTAAWRNGTHVQIQDGLSGVPWFRVADNLLTTADWRRLLDRALTALVSLHAAIRDVPAWRGTVDVRAALVEQVRRCRARSTTVDTRLLRGIEEWSEEIGEGSAVPAVWQHGDFSLNNLMVAPASIAVIDFDDFGRTSMPLHDAFGLALSFPLSQGGRCPIAMADCLEQCLSRAMGDNTFADFELRGLLLHHLLWRINESHGRPSRAGLCARLTSVVERAATASGNWMSAVEAAFA